MTSRSTSLTWHKELPPDTAEVWDVTAKALLLRLGGAVVVSEAELMQAAATPCEIAIDDQGAFHFRVESS